MDTKDTGQVAYPSQFETEVVLNDGSAMVLRPIKIEDAERYLAFLGRLGPDSRYLWLHHVPEQVTPEDALRFCTVDYKNSFALVGEVLKQKTSEIVAVGRYYRLPRKNSAEVAIVIDDAYRRKGIGTRLIECLVNAASLFSRRTSPRKMGTSLRCSRATAIISPASLRPIISMWLFPLPLLSMSYTGKKNGTVSLRSLRSAIYCARNPSHSSALRAIRVRSVISCCAACCKEAIPARFIRLTRTSVP